MRKVTFIKSLNVDLVPMLGHEEVRYHMMGPAPPIPILTDETEEYLLTEATVETMVVPVHMLRTGNRNVRDTLYIAYSKEVQDLLGMPFDVMKRELDECRAHAEVQLHMLDKYRHAKWWRRLGYLFSRNFRP